MVSDFVVGSSDLISTERKYTVFNVEYDILIRLIGINNCSFELFVRVPHKM